MTALNGGEPVWGPIEHLLADQWALTARVNSEKGSLPNDFDHPARTHAVGKAKQSADDRELREFYLNRKREREQRLRDSS